MHMYIYICMYVSISIYCRMNRVRKPKILHAASQINCMQRGCTENVTNQRYASQDTVLNALNHCTDYNSAPHIKHDNTSGIEQASSPLPIYDRTIFYRTLVSGLPTEIVAFVYARTRPVKNRLPPLSYTKSVLVAGKGKTNGSEPLLSILPCKK